MTSRYLTDGKPSLWEMQLVNLLDPRHTHHVKGFQYFNLSQTFRHLQDSLERELLQCRRSAYIADSYNIQAEFSFLTKYYPTRRFYKGREVFQENLYHWFIHHEDVSKVPIYFKGVVESGIYRRLKLEEIHQKYLRRKPVITFGQFDGSLGLNGAISTLYILYGGSTILTYMFVLVSGNSESHFYLGCKFFEFCRQSNVVRLF